MGSGVSGYQNLCGDRIELECPYSVCDGCPLAQQPKIILKLHDHGCSISEIQKLTGATYREAKKVLMAAGRER